MTSPIRSAAIPALLASALALAACGGDSSPQQADPPPLPPTFGGAPTAEGEAPAFTPAPPETTTERAGASWPVLRELDDLTHRIDRLAARSDAEGLREHLPRLRELALEVAEGPLPPSVRASDQLATMRSDLASLAAAIAEPDEITDAEVIIQAKSFHPVVVQVMHAAGIPHVH